LADLTEADLAQLGVLLGHRKKLLRAIAALPPPAKEAPVSIQAEVAGLQAERRQLTVLFCDLVGSTELSRGLDPEEVRELLRRYVDAASVTIVRHSGFVARVEGDAIVAYFGWPRADEDEAVHGVRAGLDLIATVRDLTSGDGKHLSCRTGIASGTVVVGDLDAAGRRHIGAVAGDAPNLAARLQTAAAAGQVVIDPLTRQLVGNAFVLDELGPKALKGFAEPVQVWQVLAERAAESRFEARQRRLAPFVGREQELALLKERFERALAGEGKAVLLSGEAGIGKSRLVQMLCEQLSQRQDRGTSPTRVRMQCSPSHTASTLHPVLRAP
jgi:class 3 adenylate cyclase